MAAPIIGLGEVLWDLLPAGPRAGGAPFNFAFHCQQLGHEAVIVSRVGDDRLGHDLRAEVRRLGMSDEYIQIDTDHATGTVQVEFDAVGQPHYTIAQGVAWDFIAWEDRFDPLIRSARAICFGTLAQRNPVSRQTVRRFVAARADALAICDVNLRPPFIDRDVVGDAIHGADLVKLNEMELAELARLKLILDAGLICVTRGERGCRVETRDEIVDLPGKFVQVVDTVGAGDAFTAGLLTQLLEGKPLARAAHFANALAALVASRPGGTPKVDRAEVERLC